MNEYLIAALQYATWLFALLGLGFAVAAIHIAIKLWRKP